MDLSETPVLRVHIRYRGDGGGGLLERSERLGPEGWPLQKTRDMSLSG